MSYQRCIKCVMDTTAKEILFNENGVCNFCREYDKLADKTIRRPLDIRLSELRVEIKNIKEYGKDRKYDCLIGLSGGVDSSYLCYWAKQEGLRPLIVHFDNGWNSEIATQNIEKIISKTGFDLYTYVIDWEDFKDLQIAYMKASVVDIEVPTDQLIFAALHKIAKKYKIKYLINGNNISSEAILPRSWFYADKLDLVNLTNIHKKFGSRPLKNFPKLGLIHQYIYNKLYSMHSVSPLNFLNYNKEEAKNILKQEFNWVDYGGKHYESVFTRFYQGYILPSKFGIDKRIAHLSTLIGSGLISREEALEELKKPTMDPVLLNSDYDYVTKKFGFSKDEFEKIMKEKPIPHEAYGTQWDKMEFRKYYYFKKIIGPFIELVAKLKIS